MSGPAAPRAPAERVIELPAAPTELGGGPRRVRVFASLPARGVGPNTGVLCVSLGRAAPPDNPFMPRLRQALADAHDVVAIGAEYLGVRALRTLQQEAVITDRPGLEARLRGLPALDAACRVDGRVELGALLRHARDLDLSPYVTIDERIPGATLDEHVDYGPIGALDLVVAAQGVRRALGLPGHRLLLAGSSLGAFTSMLANKLAPRTFAGVFELSGQARLSPAFLVQGQIFLGFSGVGHNVYVGRRSASLYTDDPTSPAFYSPARAALRDLLHPGHTPPGGDGRRIESFVGADDPCVPVADKQAQVAALRGAGWDARLRVIGPAEVDGESFTHAGHGLGAQWARVLLHDAADWARAARNPGPTDAERGAVVELPVPGGRYEVDHRRSPPLFRFHPAPGPAPGPLQERP